jgi:hypothetical protein
MRHRRLIVASVIGLVVWPASGPSAWANPHVTGADRVTMYAEALHTARHPIQVLGRTCADTKHRTGCVRIPAAVRSGIEDGIDAPIAWVYRPWKHAGVFFVFGPIRVAEPIASYRFRWDDPRPSGCYGGGTLRFHRRGVHWAYVGGHGFGGCPSSSKQGPWLHAVASSA